MLDFSVPDGLESVGILRAMFCRSFSLPSCVTFMKSSLFLPLTRDKSYNRLPSVERGHLLDTAAELILRLESQGKARLRESSCMIYERLSHKIGIYNGLFAQGRER